MANPATLLHAQLESWRVVRGESVRNVRLGVEDSDEEVMRQTQVAIKHLSAIGELLSVMESAGRRTRSFRNALPGWCAWILAYPHSWDAPVSTNAFNSDHLLDVLENLADALDQILPATTQDQRAGMEKALDEVRDALAGDPSLPEPLRRHLYGVLSHASTCLEEYETFGDFELQQAMDRLLVSVNMAGRVSTEPTRWEKIKEHFVFPMAVGMMLQAPENVARIAEILPPIS